MIYKSQTVIIFSPRKTKVEFVKAMHDAVNFRLSVQNKILSVLPDSEMDFLAPHLERITLSRGNMIYQSGDSIRIFIFRTTG